MKKLRSLVLCFMASLLLAFIGLNSVTFDAGSDGYINHVDGASIRVKTSDSQQGLRFYAKLNHSVRKNDHGFYLIYGETSVINLKTAIESALDGKIILNDKEVFKVFVPGVNKDNTFSVVLTGIPEDGYFDEVTVIPFVEVNNQEVYAEPVKRSIAAVALKMANDGQNISNIVSADKILETNRKRVYYHNNGNVEIIDHIFETDCKVLKEEFLNDWNAMFPEANVNFEGLDFYDSARVPFKEDDYANSYNISKSNIYKFFNSEKYGNKWEWLLEYLLDQSEDCAQLVYMQTKAVLGDGTNSSNLLFNGMHLSFTIINFFNQDYFSAYPIINFKELSRYDKVKDFNKSIFINLNRNKLYKQGHSFVLKSPAEKPGYKFEYYEGNNNKYYPGDVYHIDKSKKLNAIYKPIEYALKFYDDEDSLDNLNRTYNVKDEFILPEYYKEGYEFIGWYLNRDFSGRTIDKIEKGSSRNLNLYARMEKEADPIETYSINYIVNGGSFNEGIAIRYSEEDEITLSTPTREGYNFLGWYEDENFSGSPVSKINKGTKGDKVFYARWGSLTPSVEEKLEEAKNSLNIGYASGDNVSKVTENVTLPTKGLHNSTITWSTNNASAISNTGLVKRANNDVAVTLTATIKLDNKSVTKAFNLTVLKLDGPTVEEKLEDAKNALMITYASGDSVSKVTKNVTLPTSSMHSASITWATNNANAISNDGVVKRANNDVVVTLTATIRLDGKSTTKTFTLTVLKVEPEPDIEYTITYNLNGGAWPTTGGTSGYANRNEMIVDFLTDFYNFVKPAGISLNDFMHGPGKSSGFDGMYGLYNDETPYFDQLYTTNSKGVNANVPYFINQPQYNKWVALLDLMEEYTNFSVDKEGNPQSFWASPYTGARRIVPFIQEVNLWGHIPIEDVKAVTGKIPSSLKGGTVGDPITVPTKYKRTDNDVVLPKPEKANDAFIGWYTNNNYTGSIVTKITKGSTGNLVLYARYNSTEIPLTDQEKLDAAYSALNIGYASGDNANSVTKNITLATSGLHGTTISWTSTNTSVIATNGVVKQASSDVVVTLKATVKVGSLTKVKEFKVTVKKKIVEPTDAEKANLAKNALNITFASGDSASKVTKNVTLPKTGLHNSTITWSTNNASSVSASGIVVRKENDVNVTLIATIKVGSTTVTKTFNLKVIKEEIVVYSIKYTLNGGSFSGFKNKNELATAFLTDLRTFIGASDNINTFIHGSGKTSGFAGTWYSNEEYRAKIYGANIKTGNNNYFLSSSTYQAKWKPLSDFMVSFVKVGNPDQDFWSSPYTGNLRLSQYFKNTKPGEAWTDEDMAKMPSGLSASAPLEYNLNSLPMTLPTPTRSGYTFEGWYTNADFTSSKVTAIIKGSTGNLTFYAKWSKPARPVYTITLNLNGGALKPYTKSRMIDSFLNDLYSFLEPSESLQAFKHAAGQTTGVNGTWFNNEEHRAKIYAANIKSGNNNYFLSSDLYGEKWKPLADFMVNFVKINPDQSFWTSPSTGTLRLHQYFTNTKPGGAWTDGNMNATPGAVHPKKYSGGSQTIYLPSATRSNYEFVGWYTDNSGGSKVTQISAGASGAKTYYARWKAAPTETIGEKIIKFARTKVGNPYLYGGTGPISYDCSGLTQAAYNSAGISIPRTVITQYNAARKLSYSELQPGDLVFWFTPGHHVAIWLGDGMILHAANEQSGICIQPIYGSPSYGTLWR